MKKTILLLFLGIGFGSFGQTTTPVVVASSGDYFVGSAATLSWTLGEIMTETYTGSTNIVTQGFQQPDRGTSGLESIESTIQVNVYPNPTQANLTIEIPGNSEEILVEIYDAMGKLVLVENYTGSATQIINLESLADGLYIVTFKNKENKILESLKIQKN